MTDTGFPYLELGSAVPDFDEAVILINGHEEETIRIECTGARELAERLVWLVNNFHTILTKPADGRPAPLPAGVMHSTMPIDKPAGVKP